MSLKPYTVSVVCLIICKIVTKCPGSDFFVRSLSMISLFMLRDKCRNKGAKSLTISSPCDAVRGLCVRLWEVLWSLRDWHSLLPGNWNEASKWKCLWSCRLCWSWHHLWSVAFTSVKVKLTQLQAVCAWSFFFFFPLAFFPPPVWIVYRMNTKL